MLPLSRLLLLLLYLLAINIFALLMKTFQLTDTLNDYFYNTDEIQYDYIIVGSGTAGAILANRLSNNNDNVLLLEAGAQRSEFLNIPSVGLLLQQTAFDWQYETVPQKHACFGLQNNISRWPMGKIYGGSGMLNNLIYLRGNAEDYRDWFENQAGFDYGRDIGPYFKRIEDGLVPVEGLAHKSELGDVVAAAAEELGFNIDDNNLDCDVGFGQPKVNIHQGKRFTTSHKLNQILKNRPLTIRTNAIVEKILFKNDYEAYAVKYYNSRHQPVYAKAKKGVILSAGVIGSPKILLQSGIGPKRHLHEVGIKLKIDLPVGENLQDHVTTGFDLIKLNHSLNMGIANLLSPWSLWDYYRNGKGPFTTIGCESIGFLDRDLQFMIMPLGVIEDSGVHLRKLFGIRDDIWQSYFAKFSDHFSATFLPVVLHPKSRGVVRLKNSDFRSEPLIDPRYLSHAHDVHVLIRGIRFIQKLLATETMRKFGAMFNEVPLDACEPNAARISTDL